MPEELEEYRGIVKRLFAEATMGYELKCHKLIRERK